MKSQRIKKIITWGISLFLIYIFVSLVILLWEINRQRFYQKSAVLNISEREAIEKAQKFCDKAGVACNGETIFDESPPVQLPSLLDYMVHKKVHEIGMVDDHYIGAFVSFDEKSVGKQESNESKVILGVGRRTNEIERYWNEKIYYHLIHKYGRIKTNQFPRGRVNYPKFLSAEQATSIFLSIAQRIQSPPEMIFDGLIKNEEDGVWTAIWLRNKDSYRYEGDGMSMSIMGATGDFISYEKTYRGVDCPTVVNVTKDRALELAWNKLWWNVPWIARSRMKDIYGVKADLRIVPIGKYWKGTFPLKFEGSRLAWVVEFYFTGGLKFNDEKYAIIQPEAGTEERRLVTENRIEMEKLWKKMWLPENKFEVRIDASNGNILYSSKIDPWYLKWFRHWTRK